LLALQLISVFPLHVSAVARMIIAPPHMALLSTGCRRNFPDRPEPLLADAFSTQITAWEGLPVWSE